MYDKFCPHYDIVSKSKALLLAISYGNGTNPMKKIIAIDRADYERRAIWGFITKHNVGAG